MWSWQIKTGLRVIRISRGKEHHHTLGPAIITYLIIHDKLFLFKKEWFIKGKIKRRVFNDDEDGCSTITFIFFEDGTLSRMFWINNGRLHREDGPASLSYLNNILIKEEWYICGKLHRLGGPAKTAYHTDGRKLKEWYCIFKN